MQKSRYINVKGNPGLVRDRISGAIVNINSTEASIARKRKAARLKEKEQKENMHNEVVDLRQQVEDLKGLLASLIEERNGNH